MALFDSEHASIFSPMDGGILCHEVSSFLMYSLGKIGWYGNENDNESSIPRAVSSTGTRYLSFVKSMRQFYSSFYSPDIFYERRKYPHGYLGRFYKSFGQTSGEDLAGAICH